MTLPYEKSHIPTGEVLPKDSFWDYLWAKKTWISLTKRSAAYPVIGCTVAIMRLKKMKAVPEFDNVF